MTIPTVKVIERDRYECNNDLKKVNSRKGDYSHLRLLHDLTFESDSSEYSWDRVGSIVCWNIKEKVIEILNYER